MNPFRVLILLMGLTQLARAETFRLPTSNRALFEAGAEEKYFVGTTGKPWTSGTFGCVRSQGGQLHEGLDIRCLARDKRGEPSDPILATANGTVVYLNKKPGLSNYGNYIVLKHSIDGVEIYSLYAHLSQIRAGLKTGATVQAGEMIAVMGRTSNTREQISKERAHVHFELDLLINENFPAWFKKNFPGQRDDHGKWNGRNFLGLDPRAILLADHKANGKFNLADWIQSQTELCRVLVRDTEFPWLKRYAALARRNSAPQKENVGAYELALNFNGLPFEIIPHDAAIWKGAAKYKLLSVNETERQKNPCRKLVSKRNGRWELAGEGIRLLDLLTY